MKMKKGITNLFTILLLVVTSVTPFSISADSDGCTTEVVTNTLSGHQYCMPDNIYNYGREQDKAAYRAMVRTGNVGQDDIELFDNWILSGENLRYSILNRDLGGTVNNLTQRLKLYMDRIATGQMGRQGASVIRYLLGGDTYGSTSIMQAELESLPQSTNRNYYTGSTTNNVYNTGDTNYYSFYNPDNRTFTYNNNTYEIVNNEYNYYTFESNYYTVNNTYVFNYSYNVDNSVVNVIYNGTTTTSTYYYKLPDGRNSYNLTEDDIKGLKTDLNVINYNSVSSSDSLKALYHFDGNKDNDVYNAQDYFSINPNSITYRSDNNAFKESLYIGARLETSPNVLNFRFDPSDTLEFRLYVSDIDEINFSLTGNTSNAFNFKSYKEQVNSTITQTTTGQNVVVYNWTDSKSSISSPSLLCGGSTPITTRTETAQSGLYSHLVSCRINVTSTSNVPMISNVSVREGNLSDYFRPNEWNHVVLYRFGQGVLLYVNGDRVNLLNLFSDSVENNLKLTIYGSGYSLIDELAIVNFRKYGAYTYVVPTTPYDSNIVYTLPSTIPSGSLMIQSNIEVNNYQVGGVRPSNPTKGDVFILVNDIGFMQSLQQYDGADWVEKKGAIYNANLGLWVSYYGYSIYTRNWDYTALSELSVDDIETPKDFYSWLGAQFNNLKDTVSNIGLNITNNYNNESDQDTSDLIQNIQNENDIDISVDVNNIIGDMKDRDQNINLDNPNYNLQTGNNLSAFEPLLRETIGVFNNNNLGWVLFLPLVIAILGIVL